MAATKQLTIPNKGILFQDLHLGSLSAFLSVKHASKSMNSAHVALYTYNNPWYYNGYQN